VNAAAAPDPVAPGGPEDSAVIATATVAEAGKASAVAPIGVPVPTADPEAVPVPRGDRADPEGLQEDPVARAATGRFGVAGPARDEVIARIVARGVRDAISSRRSFPRGFRLI